LSCTTKNTAWGDRPEDVLLKAQPALTETLPSGDAKTGLNARVLELHHRKLLRCGAEGATLRTARGLRASQEARRLLVGRQPSLRCELVHYLGQFTTQPGEQILA
jgi:hypothetical protein